MFKIHPLRKEGCFCFSTLFRRCWLAQNHHILMDVGGRRGQEKEEGHDKSDRCSCDSSAWQLFQTRFFCNYTCVYSYIIYTYTRIRYSMCKCTHVHYKVYRSFHMPIPLKSTLFSKKHGDQMVSPCPTMAACFTLSRRRKKGKFGRRRKPKRRQGR